MKRWIWLTALIIGLAIVILGIYWLGSPRVITIEPPDGTKEALASQTIQITFSRQMDAESVETRLELQPETSGKFSWDGKTLTFTPDQAWMGGQTVQARLKRGARATGLLSLPTRQEINWSFTIARPSLVYLFPSDEPANLYRLNLSTGETQQLTQSSGGITDYDINHAGTMVYYSIRSGGGRSAIYRLTLTQDAPPETPELILDCPQARCSGVRVSPQEDFLAFEQAAFQDSDQPVYPRTWFLPLRWNEEGNLMPGQGIIAGEVLHQTLQPHWSPDGWLTFYDTNLQAFITINPRNEERLSFANQTGDPGCWSPDARTYVAPEISFITTNQPGGSTTIANSHLMLYQRANGASLDLSIASELEDSEPAYSPDGKMIAFARRFVDVARWTPGRQLWLMDVSGQQVSPLTNEPYYNHFGFAWHPLEQQIVYVRFNQDTLTEAPEIWVYDLGLKKSSQLVIGGFAPQWSP